MRLFLFIMFCIVAAVSLANAQDRLQGRVSNDDDPVVCFDNAYRDARDALQAYQIARGATWRNGPDCRSRTQPATELGPCWELLIQGRALTEQAADAYEQGRRRIVGPSDDVA